ESFSYILSECVREMKTNVKCLLTVPVDDKEVEKIMIDVFRFYQKTRNVIRKMDPALEVDIKAKRAYSAASKVCSTPEAWRNIFHDERNDDFKAFSKLDNKFFVNGRGPDISDKRILSECVHLRQRYEKKGAIDFMLASTDQHFVKVRNISSEICSIVPDEIEKKFNIICKWPDEILKMS
ncbi:MAG: hypothetical protein KAS04_06350, partial [Candidatus Aenigmarchaeota archaeon]|nr:hypothetical protein [Candidatus Aenigmarchaeota archaeon]